MRSGIVIAIIAGVAVIIGGFIWYNNNQAEHARLEQQRIEQAAQVTRDDERAQADESARLAEEAALDEQADRATRETERLADEQAVFDNERAVGDDAPIVIGDEITEGAIVVDSFSDEPTILDADDTATSAEIINATDSDTTTGSETSSEAAAATPTDLEQLLTPENYDQEEVLLLIDNSEQISDEERSTLRALVEGASANPAMLEPTIDAIRDALDLPPLT